MAGGTIQYQRRSNQGGKRRSRHAPMSEINVTPFVDVMLVLLVIFMVTAPLMTVGVPVDLPKTEAAQLNEAQEPLVITFNQNGGLYLQETEIEAKALIPRLIAISRNNPDVRIFIRADQSLNYGMVMQLMGQITAAGFKKIALLAELPS